MQNKVIIIAEAGVNHNGDLATAKKLIDVAAKCGVDYVKFQTFKADRLASKNAKKAHYQLENMSDADDSQYNMLKKLELSDRDHHELIDYCNNKGIQFFSTAFDQEGLRYLDNLGLKIFKSPSGEITNYPYLKTLAQIRKPTILSTGMANLLEIKSALDVLTSEGLSKEVITVLHCNTEYPTPMIDVNLKAMLSIKKELGVEIGYSDHTLGIEIPVAAVALGAKVIEKHFTLDRTLPGPDHRASLEPAELEAMVTAIRNVEQAVSGDGVKQASKSEEKNITIARKSLHLKHALTKGHLLTEGDLLPLRPGDGISPMNWHDIIGKKLVQDLDAFHKLSLTDFQ